ncbi:MAG: molybdate ABC transporter substrate-binding protein [Peptococcaceae bacterium]|jgi:molybdate transport system substrate-binding protein|nr:molybdate ABC transporter substrate-binding protein [Peptococcaceae bacterium]
MKMKMGSINKVWIFILVTMLLLSGCGGPAGSNQPQVDEGQTEILVSAAASMRYALVEIKDMYEAKKQDVIINYNFGSSGSLQKQIEQGAPVDLFISAAKTQMDALEEKDLIAEDSRLDILSNELVLIASKGNENIQSFADLKLVDRIAIGTPESVPAGRYAKEALLSMDLWDSLEDKFIQAKDVTQVLTYVEKGEVDAGLVYGSDTYQLTNASIAAVAPAETHSPIVYPAAVLKQSANAEQAQAFLDFLTGSEAQEVFSKFGFKIKE